MLYLLLKPINESFIIINYFFHILSFLSYQNKKLMLSTTAVYIVGLCLVEFSVCLKTKFVLLLPDSKPSLYTYYQSGD